MAQRNLLLTTGLTVFLTALLLTVGIQARSAAQAANQGTSTVVTPTETNAAAQGVDPVAAAQAVEQANQQLARASQTIAELQQQVITLQRALDDAYATLAEREQTYKALLDQRPDGQTILALQGQLDDGRAREQQLDAQVAGVQAQLQDAYRVMAEREAAYQAQLQQAYAQLQAAGAQGGGRDGSATAGGPGGEHGDDRGEHEEHEHDD
ncbi:MAG: hypothetical protein M5U01_14245 [Ardenticatenaceae bacterium]|nr:hypothetical protein [Ardenticatenaceae bacterium]